MDSKKIIPIRILVADDDANVLEAYRSVLNTEVSSNTEAVSALKNKLFGTKVKPHSSDAPAVFEVECTKSAEEAVEAVRKSLTGRNPFAVAFLDMRMPPGHDGAWAAAEIRSLDSAIDIVISTAYSDVNPKDISEQVEPRSKLFYVQKPFHPHEIYQLALALGGKRELEDENKKLNADKIRHISTHDALTGLPNRTQFYNRLDHEIALSGRHQRHFAIIYLDLDNFKRINDILGHHVGDQLLSKAAERIVHAVRSSDAVFSLTELDEHRNETLARMGGDEFALLVSNLDRPSDALTIANRVKESMSNALTLGENKYVVTSSIGISTYPNDGLDAHTLMKNVDMAMFSAKQSGRDNICFFNDSMNEAAIQRLQIETELNQAIKREEFTLHYQPQLDLSSSKISGLEALLRWENSVLGKVPPLNFIPIAEESGLIVQIGEWVLRTACEQMKNWLDKGYFVPRIAVNVSTIQFNQPDFPDMVETILTEAGLLPAMLELEITESVLMNDENQAISTLKRLKEIGVQLAIDDFGTGYSSLSYLKEFPIDRLKIDRSFIKGIGSDANDQAIVAAVIAMAQNMSLQVTAEGVETNEQMSYLKNGSCDEVQGFGISYPMSSDDTKIFLENTLKSGTAVTLTVVSGD